MNVSELYKKYDNVKKAAEKLGDVAKKQFPIGKIVIFKCGIMKSPAKGEVIRCYTTPTNGYRPRLHVRNMETGKLRNIDFIEVIGVQE